MPRRVSLPGADELFRTTGGMALSPSLARQQDAPRSEAARGADAAQGGEQRPPEEDDGLYAERPRRTGDDDAAEEHSSAAAAEPSAGRRGPGQGARPAAANGAPAPVPAPASDGAARRKSRNAARRPSGRERHDEKITVYVSAEELMDLEHARLVLRGEHGLAVDRGRIVREAVAVVLADLEQRGEASILVRRLRGR